jgi:hypothetical protein
MLGRTQDRHAVPQCSDPLVASDTQDATDALTARSSALTAGMIVVNSPAHERITTDRTRSTLAEHHGVSLDARHAVVRHDLAHSALCPESVARSRVAMELRLGQPQVAPHAPLATRLVAQRGRPIRSTSHRVRRAVPSHPRGVLRAQPPATLRPGVRTVCHCAFGHAPIVVAHIGNGQGTSFVTLNGVTYYPEGR